VLEQKQVKTFFCTCNKTRTDAVVRAAAPPVLSLTLPHM
jgi:hypothetical protein